MKKSRETATVYSSPQHAAVVASPCRSEQVPGRGLVVVPVSSAQFQTVGSCSSTSTPAISSHPPRHGEITQKLGNHHSGISG